MRPFIVYIAAMTCLVVGCNSQSDKIVENFKEVNKSLEQTNKAVDSLLQKKKFVGIDKKTADSLEPIFRKASFYLEVLKDQLDSADSEGEKLDVAEKLIIKTTNGDSLYKYVMAIYDVGIKYGDSSLQRSYTVFKEPTKDKWLRKYFRMIPTVAAKTILSKFQNDLVYIKFAVGSAGNKEK